jgi:hypothetical protein
MRIGRDADATPTDHFANSGLRIVRTVAICNTPVE